MNTLGRTLRFVYFDLLSELLPDPVVSSGSPDGQVVALTFDDGPNPPYTQEILDVLDRYKVKATFFLVGKNVLRYSAIARGISMAGHSIGTHTYTHPAQRRTNLYHFEREIIRTHRLISSVTGIKPQTFRPPHGLPDPLLFALLKILMGYTVILWSVSGGDWGGKDDAEVISRRILTGIKPGGIVLLHDGAENIGDRAFSDRTQTVKVLPIIIDQLCSRGYRFVTIPELLGLSRKRGP